MSITGIYESKWFDQEVYEVALLWCILGNPCGDDRNKLINIVLFRYSLVNVEAVSSRIV